jgi:hypothetical protein
VDVERELIDTGANVTAAAKRLGVPVHDLGVLTRVCLRLIDVALEVEQLRLGDAQSALFAALRSGSLHRRMMAASFILRRTEEKRRRGWGRRVKSGG